MINMVMFKNKRHFKDLLARQGMLFLCLIFLSLTLVIVIGLYKRAQPVLALSSLKEILFSSIKQPRNCLVRKAKKW